jgi:hypothetical protein
MCHDSEGGQGNVWVKGNTDMTLRDAASLQQFAGKSVTGVRRVWYVLRGEIDRSVGPIELAFADGSVLLLDAGPDGEALAVSTARWVDPFAPPLSHENERFVETSGKWTAFNVSDVTPYSALVGAVVDDMQPQMSARGKLIGVTVHAGTRAVRAVVEADEILIEVV